MKILQSMNLIIFGFNFNISIFLKIVYLAKTSPIYIISIIAY